MNAEDIFIAAVELSSETERREYISRMCPDAACVAEVESLLNAHQQAGCFLQDPFVHLPEPDRMDEGPEQFMDRSATQLGRYELTRRLGVGGMGEVYLARDTQLQRDVAVKVLSTTHTRSSAWLSRFYREARIAGAVNHPNILTVYEIGQSDEIHFIVTEYIEGITLRDRLARQSMTLPEILETASQTAGAIAAAHSASIVHRDLKPENIMIRDDGLVKVLDFGLARYIDPSDDLHAAPDRARDGAVPRYISMPGIVMGTIHYMSPEQARGLPVDTRSDLFSFGVVLYEMLTGHQPFMGVTPTDVLVAILERQPPQLHGREFELPVELEQIVRKALLKDRDQRYQSARDLCIDLKKVQQGLAGQSGSGIVPTQAIRKPLTVDAMLKVGSQRFGDTLIEADIPEVRYTCSGNVNIAYQVFGDGDIDLVFVMGWVSHLEWFWKEPLFARFLRRLGTFARVILFDKRGTGLSDRVPLDQLPTLEQRMDDVRAVMDAVDSQRAVLCGISEGGPMCALFAATYPEKTIALTMIGSYARRLWAEDYPWGVKEEYRTHFFEEIRRNWGGPVGIEDRAPSLAFDPEFRQWWATYLRMGASPGAALALTQMNAQIDIRPILSTIQVPTLVIHRAEDRCLKTEEGRYLAEHIPGAVFVELPGDDHLPFVGDQDAILDNIESFLTGVLQVPDVFRVLATVLAAKVVLRDSAVRQHVDPADQIKRWTSHVERDLALFRGSPVVFSGDHFLATFDGPTRAIRAAMAISDSARRMGLSLQAGLHIGECDVKGHMIGGATVQLAQQISEVAAANDIVVSGTVKDLVAGSGIGFAELTVARLPENFAAVTLFTVER